MKRFNLIKHSAVLLLSFVLFSGCYTTFQSARQDQAVDYGYTQTNDDGYYEEEEAYTEEPVELRYRPSRLVVEKTYYDYPTYVKRVKYVVYDEWNDPYYVYDDGPDIYLNVYIGSGYRPWRHPHWRANWWYDFAWCSPVYVTGPVWWDPWWNPGWAFYPPYPVYPVYGPPVYYPPVYYNPPYYGGGGWETRPKREQQKRDWDRRSSTGSRIVSRPGSSGRIEGPTTGRRTAERETGRITQPRQPDNSGRSSGTSTRIVGRRGSSSDGQSSTVTKQPQIPQRLTPVRRQTETIKGSSGTESRSTTPDRRQETVRSNSRSQALQDAIMNKLIRERSNASAQVRSGQSAQSRETVQSRTQPRTYQRPAAPSRSRSTLNRSSSSKNRSTQSSITKSRDSGNSSTYRAPSRSTSSRSSGSSLRQKSSSSSDNDNSRKSSSSGRSTRRRR
ncbi:MAG: hypothetical protein WAN36_02695 [Calditrichia bacterium]